jgi:CDP-glucose 4,6-dehydratase
MVTMETLFSGVYSGKTVLVTGHTGFKGSWLVLWLQLLGARVIGYALSPHTEPSLFQLSNAQEGITHIVGDTRDLSKLREVCQTYKPDFVFHLAAQSLVRYSYEHPVETYETNVMGTIHLLEAIRATPSVRVCVNVTSDKCYENREWEYSYRENDPMGGYDPYSSSKGCAELITAAYRRSFFKTGDSHGVRLASVRAGNVIGGGDWARDRLIPDCVRSLTAKSPVIVRNPEAVRPWQYVLEPLSGYLWLVPACGLHRYV